jgi:tetratricopeptide (TPR) repeat protein
MSKVLKFFLVCLLLCGPAVADDQSDYESLKNTIGEQRRVLNEYHSNRQYPEAIKLQKEIAELSRQALELALKSPDIDDPGAWNYHANTLRDVGYTEEALKAVDRYMKTPLLKRNGYREGWTKRAGIYKKQRDYDRAQDCYRKALQYAESPKEEFQIVKNQANLCLRQAQPRKALSKAEEAGALIEQLELNRRTQAQRDLQSILVKIYRDLGDSERARAAKLKELELKKALLDLEIQNFDIDYPKED